MKPINGYSVIAVPLKYGSPLVRLLYCKQHKDKHGIADGRTLFITNLSNDTTSDEVQKVFSGVGPVESVNLSGGGKLGAKFAHVVFSNQKSVKKALKMTSNQSQMAGCIANSINRSSGVSAWFDRHRYNRPHNDNMQAEVNRFLAAFDEAEEQEQAEREAEADGPDADGFITVTRKKRNRLENGSETLKPKKNKKTKVLQNFYRFQKRDAKRTQLMELRDQFEEDKRRIQKLKAGRRFRPV